ncbi:hypothetical protein BDW42DRAFT_132090 [Aspergillus taichungensis]|uniref:Uncharacterized protein n=1 Tax=Aspergillus taichungensis TaxID=482145 RepID=A0A2J5I7C0_9EURO|nr:hypothetical protein BDW42DRAFT_132090 [Aspergillus taichungensis]
MSGVTIGRKREVQAYPHGLQRIMKGVQYHLQKVDCRRALAWDSGWKILLDSSRQRLAGSALHDLYSSTLSRRHFRGLNNGRIYRITRVFIVTLWYFIYNSVTYMSLGSWRVAG